MKIFLPSSVNYIGKSDKNLDIKSLRKGDYFGMTDRQGNRYIMKYRSYNSYRKIINIYRNAYVFYSSVEENRLCRGGVDEPIYAFTPKGKARYFYPTPEEVKFLDELLNEMNY